MRILKRGVDWDFDPELEESDELELGDIPGGWGVNENVWTPELHLLPRFRKEDEAMGYWNLQTDSWEIEPEFREGTLFHNGVAAVRFDDNQWFFIDAERNLLQDLGVSETRKPEFTESRIVVDRNGRPTIIDYDGNEIYSCPGTYDMIWGYENGICRIDISHENDDEDDSVFIDLNGHELNGYVHESRPDGYAIIELNNQIHILTPEGHQIEYPHTLDKESSYLGPGLFRIQNEHELYGAADIEGKIIIPIEYLEIGRQGDNGWFPVKTDNGAFYIDRDNKAHLDFGFRDTEPFNCHGFAIASSEDGCFGIIDSNGIFVIPPTFERIRETEPLLWICRDKNDGDVIIGPGIVDRKLQFNSIVSPKEGLFLVYTVVEDEKGLDSVSDYAFIDRYGEVKIPQIDCLGCHDFNEGLAEVQFSDVFENRGYIDHWGTIVKDNYHVL